MPRILPGAFAGLFRGRSVTKAALLPFAVVLVVVLVSLRWAVVLVVVLVESYYFFNK